MVSLNKILMSIVVMTAVIVKAEESTLNKKLEASPKNALEILQGVDVADLARKANVTAQKFFTTEPKISEVLGLIFAGRATFRAASRINPVCAFSLLGGNWYYNSTKKASEVVAHEKVVENKQENVLPKGQDA